MSVGKIVALSCGGVTLLLLLITWIKLKIDMKGRK